jgi:translation initiation factor 4A
MATELVCVEDVAVYESFDSMDLKEELLRGIYAIGFQKPSPIQTKGIKVIADGRDLLAQAQSGTGKTGTYSIGSLQRIDPSLKTVQVLCLVPTRELGEQVNLVASALGSNMGVKSYAAMGKTPVRDDMRALSKGVQFLVGTPGRIYDLLMRHAFTTRDIKVIIVDEADQMLEDRFREQLQHILDIGFPATTRCALFSATLSEDVKEFAMKLLDKPVKIIVPVEEVNLAGINQYSLALEQESWKLEVLLDLYKNLNITQALIFCNTRNKVEQLSSQMTAAGFPITCIHADLEIKERMARMISFRKGETRVLIATDLLARGIDVQQVSLVINYELPVEMANYIHRIGRGGRFGRKGTAINLLCGEDVVKMNEIVDTYKITVNSLPEDLGRIDL